MAGRRGGLYSQIHPGIPDRNLRGRFRSDDEGRFELLSIAPPPYETEGRPHRYRPQCPRPALLPAGPPPWKLPHEYFGDRTSQLYFPGSEYLDSDVANAVRDELVLRTTLVEDAERIERQGLAGTFVDAQYNFAFAPTAAPTGA